MYPLALTCAVCGSSIAGGIRMGSGDASAPRMVHVCSSALETLIIAFGFSFASTSKNDLDVAYLTAIQVVPAAAGVRVFALVAAAAGDVPA